MYVLARQMASPAAFLFHVVVVILAIVLQFAAGNNIDRTASRRKLISGISSFEGIDCGSDTDYEDDSTRFSYTSDKLRDTGTSSPISEEFMTQSLWRQLKNLRSFPQENNGNNSCYTFTPSQARGNKFLIRALFMYGNYDSLNQPPEFELYVDVNKWDDVNFDNASSIVIKEIIHKPATDYIHVCLVNTGSGTPFISALELIQLNATIYEPKSGSLVLYRRLDLGATESNQKFMRYNDDFYGRIWEPRSFPNWEPIPAAYTSGMFADNLFKPSLTVMGTAVKPVQGSSLKFHYTADSADSNQQFYLYMHFLEVEDVKQNDRRKFDILLNNRLWHSSVIPNNRPYTIYSTESVGGGSLSFSLQATNDSTLPPILNALEIYIVKEFWQSPSAQSDVDAIIEIKKAYSIKKNWQGDPCMPEKFHWDGLECSNNNQNGSTIISLNLASSGLTKEITRSLSKLSSLQHLDLSNNSLTGSIPDFLADMESLRILNLSGNKLTGSIPRSLIERNISGKLTISLEENPGLCLSASCNHKNKIKTATVVLVAVLSFLVLLVVVAAIIWKFKRKRQGMTAQSRQERPSRPKTQTLGKIDKSGEEMSLRSESQMLEMTPESRPQISPKGRIFTYDEIKKITNEFENCIGKGASSNVFLGTLEDKSQVAVKVLNIPSVDGSKVFEREVRVLMTIHYKHLVPLVGYCCEGAHRVLIYEYMPGGNLKDLLSGKTKPKLTWKERLQIAQDAAQGLEYLHDGCQPSVIHRDVKPANILLNENLRAKIADFGIAEVLATETDTTLESSVLAGTPAYIAPDCRQDATFRFNEKSDVYSFGIILYELMTGKPAIIKDKSKGIRIVTWVNSAKGNIDEIMDPRLKGEFNVNSARKVLETANGCVHDKASERKKMNEVLAELKEAKELEEAAGMTENKATKPNLPLEEDLDIEKASHT